jgi:hypothetical protein
VEVIDVPDIKTTMKKCLRLVNVVVPLSRVVTDLGYYAGGYNQHEHAEKYPFVLV